MRTEIVKGADGNEYCIHEDGTSHRRKYLTLKSTDEKPIEGMRNTDLIHEFDTGKVFMFDEDAKVWLEQ